MKDLRRIKIRALSLSFLIFLCGSILAQQAETIAEGTSFKLTQKKYDFQASNSIILNPNTLNKKRLDSKIKVPLIYDFNKLALFCKFEESVAKNSNLNMRFRLGSLDYVDQLEQKPYTKTSIKN